MLYYSFIGIKSFIKFRFLHASFLITFYILLRYNHLLRNIEYFIHMKFLLSLFFYICIIPKLRMLFYCECYKPSPWRMILISIKHLFRTTPNLVRWFRGKRTLSVVECNVVRLSNYTNFKRIKNYFLITWTIIENDFKWINKCSQCDKKMVSISNCITLKW